MKKTGNGWTVLDASAVAVSWDGNQTNKCPVTGVMSGGAGGLVSYGTFVVHKNVLIKFDY